MQSAETTAPIEMRRNTNELTHGIALSGRELSWNRLPGRLDGY
jgi:hypothetical protein